MLFSFIQSMQKSIGMEKLLILNIFYMAIRGIIIYFLGIIIARFNKKLMGIRTPFNFTLFIMLGSLFASAIIDDNIFIPVIFTTVTLCFLNSLMTILSYYVPFVEYLIKGSPVQLIKNSEIQWPAMNKYFITERELYHELNNQLNINSLEKVESVILESDGTINFILK